MLETKFYICTHCGNIVEVINDSGVPLMCCGQKMQKLIAGENENAAVEKHIPIVSVNGDTVKVNVGEIAHPMTIDHSIQWVYLKTDKGIQRKNLCKDNAPVATFFVGDEKPLEAFAYCNLHGLWKSNLS